MGETGQMAILLFLMLRQPVQLTSKLVIVSIIHETVKSPTLSDITNLYRLVQCVSILYLASPYGFAESTKPFLEDLKYKLRKAGHKVNDPWEIGERHLKTFQGRKDISLSEREKINHELASLNHKAICESKIVVACLDGPDVDSGTASEIGFAYAKGKKIFGYREDIRRTGENEAALVNMQVQYWIEKSQGRIVNTVKELLTALNEQSEPLLAEEKPKKSPSGKGS